MYSNLKLFKNNASFNNILAYSSKGINLTTNRLGEEDVLHPENRINSTNQYLTFKSYFNKRFSDHHRNRTGLTLRWLGYDIQLEEADENVNLQSIANQSGTSSLMALYSSSSFNAGKWKISAGLTTQLFTLNNNYTVEPRLGLAYQINANNALSFAYGLHSRIEPLSIYFSNTVGSSEIQGNKSLDFTKAHHLVLAYDIDLGEKLHLKIEPYYQYLYDVPILKGKNESLLNLQNDWFITDVYENTGKGQNYGLDITLEQYMNKGFYFLISGSIFQSKYKTVPSNWFNTRFNKNFLFNTLVGKEFYLGGNQQNTLSINLRLSLQGGERYSRIDKPTSYLEQEVVYDESLPFTKQANPSKLLHTTISYQWNGSKFPQKLSLKILNAFSFKEFQGHRYNLQTREVEKFREALMIPNLSYKVFF